MAGEGFEMDYQMAFSNDLIACVIGQDHGSWRTFSLVSKRWQTVVHSYIFWKRALTEVLMAKIPDDVEEKASIITKFNPFGKNVHLKFSVAMILFNCRLKKSVILNL